MANCSQIGFFGPLGDYICPAGYISVSLGDTKCCSPVTEMVLGDDGVYGTIGIPEIVISSGNAATPATESAPAKGKQWLKDNWYLIVMPLSVIAIIFLWKKYGHKLKFNKKK